MYAKSIIFSVITYTAIINLIYAQTKSERDLSRIKEQREKTLAEAEESINVRYKSALEALLRQATQASDLQTANKIDVELKKLNLKLSSSAVSPAAKAESFKELLVGTTWSWFGSETLTFLADGKARWSNSSVLWEWKVTSPSDFVVEGKNMYKDAKFKFTFDKNLETAVIEDVGLIRTTHLISK